MIILKPLDMQVKTVFEEEKTPEKPTIEELDKARFFVTLRDVATKDKLMGWRVDDLAGLAITISYIVSQQGPSNTQRRRKTARREDAELENPA